MRSARPVEDVRDVPTGLPLAPPMLADLDVRHLPPSMTQLSAAGHTSRLRDRVAHQLVGRRWPGGHGHGRGGSPCQMPRRGDESACKPGSVPRHRCRHRGDDHPSRVVVADDLQRPTRALGRAALERALSGLAPGGVYRADPVARIAGGLLHHPFTLTSSTEVDEAVCFLWHCPAGRPGWLLATTTPCGARTFLDTAEAVTQPSGRLIREQSTLADPRGWSTGPIR